MKLFIASDIHGSLYFCKKMLECFEAEKADKLLLLGDILYHGPRNALPKDYNPAEVIPLLNAMKDKILCVRGNCDAEVDQMVLEFPILADYLSITVGDTTIYATHGHLPSEKLPSLRCGDILLSGHTHIPLNKTEDGITYLNPGSVSIPKENSHHGYMLFEDGTFLWKDFDGNIVKI
ncbi:MAG: phosphodiesterase [Clostridia bacterium]|nr:phosphodiesterase [Clostridia bacterium]